MSKMQKDIQNAIKEVEALRKSVYETTEDWIDDLDDMAALCGSLDSVVTTMVALQWLAAAIGTPAWTIARGQRKSEWCMLGHEYYPWFPELKVCFERSDDLLIQGFRRVAKEISM